MKARGFTLIEVMASLLIFAIGGTMALTVFNFNAGSRIDIDEKAEAYLLANNIIKTLILKEQTCTSAADKLKETGSSWQKSGTDVYPRHDHWNWFVIPAYPQLSAAMPATPRPLVSANPFFTQDYTTNPPESIFEYGYCVVHTGSGVGNTLISYYRTQENWKQDTSNPLPLIQAEDDIRFLRVVVTWPRLNPDGSDKDRAERKRVSVVSAIPAP